MSCNDVLSLADLQTAKKHQIFEAEVITGKAGGVAGGASIETATNPVTGQVQKTMPAILRDAGFRPASFDFTSGGTLTANDRGTAVYDPVSKSWYSWTGSLPHVVAAGTDPKADSTWRPQTDPTIRDDLASSGAGKGVQMVANAVDKRGDTMQRLNITGDGTAAATGNLVVGNLPITPGTDAARDAITVSRLIQNGPTNCHAYADKTVIDTATDYGGYGAFDSTLKLKGAHTQNHAYSYQDRIEYNGGGVLENLKGFMSAPIHTGSGLIKDRTAIYVNDVVLQSTGTLTQQNGIMIEHLKAATQQNVAIHVKQMSGLAWYAPNAGRMYQNGVAGFGVDPTVSNFPINFRGSPNGTFYGFATTDANGASFGASGDTKVSFVAGNEVRLQIKTAATYQRAVTPGNDNLTPCGDMVNRWSVFFAGTGTINTSDGREKTAPIAIETLSGLMKQDPDAILDAWSDVSLIAFQWLNSIDEKGAENARWHFGVIAQQVRDAFTARGLDGTRFGLLCHDVWDDQYDDVAEETVSHPAEYSSLLDTAMKPIVKKEAWIEVIKPASRVLVTPAGDRWGIRADQCLWLEAAYQRRERSRLEARVLKLETSAA